MCNPLLAKYLSSKQQGEFVHRKEALHYVLVCVLSLKSYNAEYC